MVFQPYQPDKWFFFWIVYLWLNWRPTTILINTSSLGWWLEVEKSQKRIMNDSCGTQKQKKTPRDIFKHPVYLHVWQQQTVSLWIFFSLLLHVSYNNYSLLQSFSFTTTLTFCLLFFKPNPKKVPFFKPRCCPDSEYAPNSFFIQPHTPID